MVFVEIGDQTLRASLAAFLDARFGGSVFDRENGLELDFHVATMPAATQLRAAERLLWAWHIGLNSSRETEVTLTASPAATDPDSDSSDHQTTTVRLLA